jgi:hypothetical protein
VVDKVVEILFVGLWTEAFASDPLNVVLFVDAVVLLNLLRKQLITIMTQQFYGFLKSYMADKIMWNIYSE